MVAMRKGTGVVLAIDYGTKRIGLAVTDAGREYIFPRQTLQRQTLQVDHAALADLCRAEAVELVVVGLPLNTDGSEGPMARAARAFGAGLHQHLGLEVTFADERYSSQEADEQLRERFGRLRRPRRSLRDRVAAAIILRTFLEHGPYLGSGGE